MSGNFKCDDCDSSMGLSDEIICKKCKEVLMKEIESLKSQLEQKETENFEVADKLIAADERIRLLEAEITALKGTN